MTDLLTFIETPTHLSSDKANDFAYYAEKAKRTLNLLHPNLIKVFEGIKSKYDISTIAVKLFSSHGRLGWLVSFTHVDALGPVTITKVASTLARAAQRVLIEHFGEEESDEFFSLAQGVLDEVTRSIIAQGIPDSFSQEVEGFALTSVRAGAIDEAISLGW